MDRTTTDLMNFVKSKPKDRIINHISWHTCAVGDWWHNDIPIESRDKESWIEISQWMEENATNWWTKIGCQAGVSTYGTLLEYMRANQPVKQKKRK